jgi:Zn-dependent M28 family amino/carboxypeptidase
MLGTDEPKLYPLSDSLRFWSDSIRKEIAIERIRADLVALPAPRNRLYACEAMFQADHMILERFTDADWSAEQQPFAFDNIEGTADNSPNLVHQQMVYERLEGVNIVATKKGIEEPQKAIVILGHHDTVRNSPGANDNTASVAAILELARALAPWKFRYSVILATTDMEELWFIGARALVKTLLESYEVIAAINFETMGFTATEPGTQSVPPGLGLLYGKQIKRIRKNGFRGDFTCIIYNSTATVLASMVATALNHQAGPNTALLLRDPNDLPFIGKALRMIVPAVRNFSRSDHVLFWEEGVAALQITDTANFRYCHYHQSTDTPEKVDYERVAAIVAATATVVARTAGLI